MLEIGVNGEGVNEGDLLTGRSCIIAQTGAGKSYGVAVICEQLAGQNLGFCVIDTEGEYFSLKQEFDILWVGGVNADVNVNDIDLRSLAFKVIKEGIPVILDVSEVDEYKTLVDEWVKSLYEAASELKNPYLLVIEEADKFVPQRGVKLESIYEVARRGRKRGLGLLVASQRPALVNKEVLSQCNHQFIGKLTVESDLDAVKHFFGSRKDLKSLPGLLPGEFFMVGFKPEESLFKFKARVTEHEGVTPDVKRQLPPRIEEVVKSLTSGEGLGVKELVSKAEAESIALKNAHKKYLLFGERERVESIRLFYKPLIELLLKVPRKKLLSQGFVDLIAYLTPELMVVNNKFSRLFDLSFMKDLSKDEVKVLLSLLYDDSRTISQLMSKTNLGEDDLRVVLKDLVDKDFIKHEGWSGKHKVFEVIKRVDLPRIVSLCSDRILTSIRVNEDFSADAELFKRVLQSLDYKVNIIGSKVIYYPFYKMILRRAMVSRELLVNAVTGRVM